MRRHVWGIVAGAASVLLLAGCAGSPPDAVPTATVTTEPEPAPTVTIETAPAPDAQLNSTQAWTMCAAAGLGALNGEGEARYPRAAPATGGEVMDHDDGTFTVTVWMEPTEGEQPAYAECEVSGSMNDPRVSYEHSFVD